MKIAKITTCVRFINGCIMDKDMGNGIEAHIKIVMIICCIALLTASLLASGIPKIPVPSADILGLGRATLEASSQIPVPATASGGLLLLFYLIAAVVVAYCLVGLINSFLSYLRDPDFHRIKAYLRKGTYYGYSMQSIQRRLIEQGWEQERIDKAKMQVFQKG